MSAPRVSVVAPTFRDWPRAALLVRALLAQTVPDFEILLVNNAPDDPAPADFPIDPRLTLLVEPAPGSYAARNRGAAAARGTFLAFTDSDCIPEPDWLAQFLRAAEGHDGLISGRVAMFSEARPMDRLTWAESYDFFFGITQDVYARDGGMAARAAAVLAHLGVVRAPDDPLLAAFAESTGQGSARALVHLPNHDAFEALLRSLVERRA